MDDTQKQQSSSIPQDQKPQENTVFQFVKPVSVPTDDFTQQITPSIDDTQTEQPVSVPAGRSEGEPIPVAPIRDTQKWVEASEPQEIQLPPELAEIGVQTPQEEKPDLDEEDKNAGIDYAPPIIPVNVDPQVSRIRLPMTEEEAKKVMEHPNPSSSLYWLAMTILRQIAWFKHNPPEKQV